jgi:uncharacterized protein YbaR (Trm112 family)
MIDQSLLEILVCPENKTPVHLAGEDLVAKVNSAIDAGSLQNRIGEKVDTKIDAGLVREDGAFLYAIRDDIPIMLIDQSIPLAQVN